MENISRNISILCRRNIFHTVFFLLCVISIVATPTYVSAQTTYLPRYTSKNGLASNNCYYIHQDKKGFIWIATDAGLSRFDGTNFQNFTIEDGLPDTQILQIKEDRQGKLWFLALNGQLSYLKDGKFYNRNNSALLKKLNFNTVIVSFLEDKKGRIWLGTNSNLIVLWDGKSIKKFVSPNINQQFTNAFLHEDEVGDIYSYSDESTQKYSGNSFSLINNNVNPLSYMTAFNAPNRSLYYLDGSGLNQYQNGKISSIIRIPDNLLKNMSGYFYYDVKEQEVWLASNNGALVLNKSGKTVMYLQGIAVNQSIKDNSNNMWFATNQGIYMLPNVNSRLFILSARNTTPEDKAMAKRLS
ncbi:MAG: hypothetical protein EOO96_27330 [Pedobacter sp.]|nr:MAG: hypothetical protein EOO96_27330 [Pedobacter sp.]